MSGRLTERFLPGGDDDANWCHASPLPTPFGLVGPAHDVEDARSVPTMTGIRFTCTGVGLANSYSNGRWSDDVDGNAVICGPSTTLASHIGSLELLCRLDANTARVSSHSVHHPLTQGRVQRAALSRHNVDGLPSPGTAVPIIGSSQIPRLNPGSFTCRPVGAHVHMPHLQWVRLQLRKAVTAALIKWEVYGNAAANIRACCHTGRNWFSFTLPGMENCGSPIQVHQPDPPRLVLSPSYAFPLHFQRRPLLLRAGFQMQNFDYCLSHLH